MSDAEPPAADADAQAKALGLLAGKVYSGAAKDWASLLGSGVTFAPPTVEALPPEGIPSDLPWPLKACTLDLSGDLEGRLVVLIRALDAPVFEKHPEGGEPQDLLMAAMGYLAESSAKVVARGERKIQGSASPAVEASGVSALVEAGAPMGGWMARTTFSSGEHKNIPAWLLVPSVLGGTLAEDFMAAPESAPTGGKGKVLVIDDQYTIRSLLKRILAKEGFTVVEGTSGDEGLQKFRREKPILVICDVMMPGMNGYETVRKIREMEGGRDVKVVMCTAKGQRSDVAEALQAGANDYIVKPFTREIVLAKVAKALGS